MIEVVPIPAFRDNYIWALCGAGQVVVVDPGDAAPVRRFLAGRGLALAGILVTHHHHDHVGGLAGLGAAVPVFGPAGESITGVTHPLAGGETIALPGVGLTLQVLAVPGHTRAHIAYHGDGMLFCGDTLFGAGCGRLFEGTPQQMHASLQKIAALPPATRVYCAHEYTAQNLDFAGLVEPDNADIAARIADTAARRARGEPTVPSLLADELRTNPFLRCGEPAVQRAVAKRAASTRPVDVFAAVRAWRDEV